MKIAIVGAGEVGSYLSETLSAAGHDATIIERSEQRARILQDQLDVRVVQSSGTSARTLLEAGVDKCSFFLAMTSSDETNLVASSIAKSLGAEMTFARIHDATIRNNSHLNYQERFGIDHLVNPEALAAVELAKRIRNPGRVAVEDFGRGQIEVKSVEIKAGASVIGKPLKQLNLPSDVRIGLCARGEETLVANASTILQAGDTVTLFGNPNALYQVQEAFDPNSHSTSTTTVTLLSGSEIAISLARLLSNPRFKLRIIERDAAVCRSLAEQWPKISVIHGEGTSLRLLQEEEIGHTDFFVACSKEDEVNIMTCLQAHKLGATHTLLAMNRNDYLPILDKLKESLGVELAVSPRIAAAQEVLRYINKKAFIELEGSEGESSVSIIELRIGSKSAMAGQRLRDLSLPEECVIVGVENNYVPRMPTGDDFLQADDFIIAVISKDKISELVKMAQ